MVVAWRPPVPSHGVITEYEIRHDVLVGDKPRLIRVDHNTLQYRISELAINTSYVVQVRASYHILAANGHNGSYSHKGKAFLYYFNYSIY